MDRSRPIPRCVWFLMLWLPSRTVGCQKPPAVHPPSHCDQASHATAPDVRRCLNRVRRCRWNRIRGSVADVGGASGANSHLAGRDELQRPEGGLEVGGVGLEVVEGAGDALLELRGVLAAGAVGRDLVEGRGAHVGGCRGYRVDDLRGGSGESEGGLQQEKRG